MGRRSKVPAPVTDDEVNEFLTAFALRFDGYAYAVSRGEEELLTTWSQRFVATLQMAGEPNEDHAAFFALQRYLNKWGGEMLSEQSREHLAYRLLFLHLYRVEIDPKFAPEWGITFFRNLDLGRVEAVAAGVREQVIALTLQHGHPLRPSVWAKPPAPEPG